MALTGVLLDRIEDLEASHAEWDALAVSARRPCAAPAWMLAWWRHARPHRAELRAVAVRDGHSVVAVAPFFVERHAGRPGRYRLLAAGVSHRAEPVARRGLEREAADIIARTLAQAEPHPAVVYLESADTRSRWASLLTESWPGRSPPWSSCEWSAPAPTVQLEGLDFDGWMRRKSRNFRSQAGRLRRRLEGQGAQLRIASNEAELNAALKDFARLHYARWQDRGGTVALNPSVERMLADAGHELLSSGRFRAVTIEVDGRAISAHLFVAAGGEVSYWNGGFDERWASSMPSILTLIAAIEDAFERSDTRLDLGGGGHPYKYRLADGEDTLESTVLVPRAGRYALTRLQLAPHQARRDLAGRTPAPLRTWVRRFRRRHPT